MSTKAEKTSKFIIETVAPIFNKNGYAATSLSDITAATGLTKGAIYGNFENKDELALAAFKFNVKKLMVKIGEYISKGDTPLEKLLLIADFYKEYYHFSMEIGGCPVLNIGIDANNNHDVLLEKVQESVEKIQGYIENLIDDGLKQGEIRNTIVAKTYAKRFYSLLQGAIFMSQTMKDNSYIVDAANVMRDTINQRFRQ